jgi:phage terminase small subunit
VTKKRAKAGTSKASTDARKAYFVEAYIANGGNATEAAKAAGFAPKSAHVRGSELVKDRKIATEIAVRRQALQVTHGLTTDRILTELRRIALYDPRKLFNADGSLKAVHELDEDTAAAIASVEVDEIGVEGTVIGQTKKVKAWDKNAALEKAMKHLGLFEKDNSQSGPVVIFASARDERL